MLTNIGKFLRKLRIDNGEILKDMAEALGVSSSFLSAVENGKKKMPASWTTKLAELYSFNEAQSEELHEAVIDTNNAIELNLQNATPNNRALAISFAREFDSLDYETSKKILEILKRRKED
ncbi:MAG: helix-turn-helix domain-containing protein [Clostridiales bacterium]|nr:helix-turn-helix domain-containing protein [Clostridiales bacterium]